MKKGKRDIKDAYRTAYLVSRYIKGNLSEDEQIELDAWKAADPHNIQLFNDLIDENNLDQSLVHYGEPDLPKNLDASKEKMRALERRSNRYIVPAIAAAVAALIALTIVLWPSGKSHQPIATTPTNDVLPGSSNAVLTLPDGRKINLSTQRNDTVLSSGVTLHGLQGELAYSTSSNSSREMHTLTVPTKGMFRLTLPDGTGVFLNSQSSIQYPTVFAGSERRVIVSGETYFDVAPDKTKPFRVQAEGLEVEAIGTAFGIYAFPNEQLQTVALVEGKVKTRSGTTEKMMTAGNLLEQNGNVISVVSTDLRPYTEWRNNQFIFSNTPVTQIMNSVARWYGVEIVYKEKVTAELNATISRSVPLSRLLALLEKTNEVHFTVTGNQISVSR